MRRHARPSFPPPPPPTACLILCADGGANRLFDAAPGWAPDTPPDAARRARLPAAVVGDLDSLRPDVRDFYEKEGVAIVDRGHDQETTDLQKCLAFAAADPRPSPSSPLLALGALGGRLDHTRAALSLMHADAHAGRLVLAGDGSLARCVPVGGAVFTPAPGVEGPACGLVALGGPVRASTEGLAWNLAPGAPPLAVGGPQSTSNLLAAPTVDIACDGRLLWTTELCAGDR